MKLSKYFCPWCEVARLEFMDVCHDAPNGPTATKLFGISLACSLASVTNCPDTTGACDTEAQADAYAKELGCKTQATPAARLPSGAYTQRAQAQQKGPAS